MTTKNTLIITTILVVTLGVVISMTCSITDKEAKDVFNKFCKTIHVNIDGERWVLGKTYYRFNPLNQIKEIVVGQRGSFKASANVSCKTKEVLQIVNHEIRKQVFNKYNISLDNRRIRSWPKLLSENKAKQIAFSYAQQIGLPSDVKFSHMSLDTAYTGAWIAHWIRMHNEYQYENDFLSINIMAIDGEFYSYGKHFRGSPCKTEVKVSKEDAIKVSQDKVNSLISDNQYKNNVTKYVATSSELIIVQPNAILGIFTPFHDSSSRLAWVITYILPSTKDMNLAESANFVEKIVIKVDAASGRVIGGSLSK
jgi:hypothetical protein